MIVATAGHVDHGKTSLIRGLTGVETDTLAEEIERGLSINLGYAYLSQASDHTLGFIDVPGHRRFINTMISGISGVDMGLLVVAADDGPMPQTLEHIDVLDILGVEALCVVINKVDRVDALRVSEVLQQVDALLQTRRWPEHVSFAVSSQSGQGLEALKKHLVTAAETHQRRRNTGGFRLSIDRSFNINGVGLVVTGTASAGEVKKGDLLELLPGGQSVRIRHLRANNCEVDRASVGQRVALALAGKVSQKQIERGDWLVTPNGPPLSQRLDVEVTLLGSAPYALKHMTPVKLYIGAKRRAARLAHIDRTEQPLKPGESCFAQLILDDPISGTWGEPILIQDHAETLVLGGGKVLDPEGPKFGKSRNDRLHWLRALQISDAKSALTQLLHGEHTVDLSRFWRNRNYPQVPESPFPSDEVRIFEREGNIWAVTEKRWQSATQWLADYINRWHREQPQSLGVKMTSLNKALAGHFDLTLGLAAADALLRSGGLALREGHISRQGFQPAKSQEALDHWQALKQQLQQGGVALPLLSDLLTLAQVPDQLAKQALRIGMGWGELHELNKHRYALPTQLLHYYQCLTRAHDQGEALSVAVLKSRFGTGRNLTVEILEHFDRLHLTRREGNVRVLLARANVQRALGLEA
ncbi:MAG: selenocysteine-specific translation elongation factor [Luminiphilus sp.]|nr:selenocysteine-specific translation elongation factor [Luminiphilus sp.]